MHEELKKEFEERFINGIDYKNFPLVTNIWDWFESKLPKEVEIESNLIWDYFDCPNCTDYVSEGSLFCPNCGAKINWK